MDQFCMNVYFSYLKSLGPRQNGRHFADDIFKCIFENENIWIPIKISLKFVPKGAINNIPALVQIIAWRRAGGRPLSEPMMVSLSTHIWVTRPRWVNSLIPGRCEYICDFCPACQTSLIATRFWVVVICPIIKCLTVLEFSFILFDLCLFITIFNFILNYVPIVTFWIFTYHKIWILLIIFCFIWNYWIIYFLTCLEVFWSVVS